ncbi:unnamed protein product [Acanthoscelides obtectus]|uniref:PIN domain-containing protein n=1 Tax=Acanthoscelides obtectus TaxID=200917 RepID=A0A9P0KU96_ACAOB|nr:unnamed protein product [Acanthoscelides obtectus]CAK1646528.1 Telomerase-binding protein EST1A [Acanthoscelides obtectus]
MRRGKPLQQIYKPGSGPLRKSNNGVEEQPSFEVSRFNAPNNSLSSGNSRNTSESNSPRDTTAALRGDSNSDKDPSKRQKKPEQIFYIPRPVAQAKESNSVQDSNRNMYSYSNEKPSNGAGSRFKPRGGYSDANQDQREFQERGWRDKSPTMRRGRQGSEPRGFDNDRGHSNNWGRTRDSWSVEPSGPPSGYNRGEKIQSKPPSVPRRHSTVGLEGSHIPFNLDKLPPRLRKKYLEENNITVDPGVREDNWDGSSMSFQSHGGLKNPSFHQYGGSSSGYQAGYHTLPNKPSRGRGRYTQGRHQQPGPDHQQQSYRCSTPDSTRSPAGSRPPTPPLASRRGEGRPVTPPLTFRRGEGTSSRPQTPVRSGWGDDQQGSGWHDGGHGGGNSRGSRYNRSKDGRDRNTPVRESPFRERPIRETSIRETPSRETPIGETSRDSPSRDLRRDRDSSNRKDRNSKRGFSDKRRNRRNKERSRSREHKDMNYRDKYEDDRFKNRDEEIDYSRHQDNDVSNHNKRSDENDVGVQATKVDDVRKTEDEMTKLEVQMNSVTLVEMPLASVQLVQQAAATTLDWSEEVELELCDRLEDNFSDAALPRSDSLSSLQEEISTMSLPPNIGTSAPSSTHKRNKRTGGRKSRNGSRNRSRHRDLTPPHVEMGPPSRRSRQNSTTSVDSRDGGGWSRRRGSRDRREGCGPGFWATDSSRGPSRDVSLERVTENWRDECVIKRSLIEKNNKPSLDEIKDVDTTTKKAGVIIIPHANEEPVRPVTTVNTHDHPRYPETRRTPTQQKALFDPNNPEKPIIVKSSSPRVAAPGFSDNNVDGAPPPVHTTDQFGNLRPPWYEETSDGFKSCHYPDLLRDIKRADTELQYIINSGCLLSNWGMVDQLRQFLKEALEYLLTKAIKFCESENVEQHFWNILYHNIIELMRKAIKNDPVNKDKYKTFLLYLIDEGSRFFERLLKVSEEAYGFKLSDFLDENSATTHKGLGLVSLALVCAQKLYMFLGDLGRYKEEVNESANYGKCRQWYIKSHEINPKNGKPYNQLALLAVHARRKLDAVYYYMRSLMSSNPVPSARESLISLLDENRKKFEQSEKKRREERQEQRRRRQQQLEKEREGQQGEGKGTVGGAPGGSNALRKETWVHPEGGPRVHRTTRASEHEENEEEDLAALSSVEVNKRFVISYLHVHGKLITKIGMETFQETSLQMLREFRALLQHSPVPLPCNRFLQLLALNMFAIESTQLRDPQLQSQPGYRSEVQERALVVSLQMFSLILERCVAILREHLATRPNTEGAVDSEGAAPCSTPPHALPPDVDVLLPAVKVWCDWLLGHAAVWNPPPNTQDFRVGSPGDAWSRLAILMNLLEMVDQSTTGQFVKEEQKGYVQIRLPEDAVLRGFTPLSYAAAREPTFAPSILDTEAARAALRVQRLLFFGTVYLCGVEPPVLRLEIEDGGRREYVSTVDEDGDNRRRGRGDEDDEEEEETVTNCNDDVLLESISGEEDEAEEVPITSNTSTAVRDLLTRKVELEKRKRNQELHMQRVQKILSQSVVSVHMEIWPKYLVPDTNCFIDHLEGIKVIAQAHCYTLMVPIIVLNELEGLSRGTRPTTATPTETGGTKRQSPDPQHVLKVAQFAKEALDFLKTRHSTVKCITTKGAVLPSTNFYTEDDAQWSADFRNDDKILTTCLLLGKNRHESAQEASTSGCQPPSITPGEPRRLYREVVLLTEDRNLRVKAHARDVPVRELPDFMRWAGLGGPAG